MFIHYVGETFSADCQPRVGLICQNSQQNDGFCQDYRVRFLCPAGTIRDTSSISTCFNYCVTNWLDRDNPSGKCDCETLKDFSPYQTCRNPSGAECREKNTGQDWQDVGQVMQCNARVGGVCWNSANPGQCKDYEVRFICPCVY